MKRLLVLILGPLLIIGLGSFGLFRANKFKYEPILKKVPKLEIEILFQDSTLNVRALELIKDAESGVFLTSDVEWECSHGILVLCQKHWIKVEV